MIVTNLNYVESGNKFGIPLIFIHAFPLNQEMWDDQIKYLQNNNSKFIYNSTNNIS